MTIRLAVSVALSVAAARERCYVRINAQAAHAAAEIRAMGERDRRSLGQKFRWMAAHAQAERLA